MKTELAASRFALLQFLLCAIAFFPSLSATASFFYRDFALFGYPLAHFHRESFWQGELPFWNPYNNCGLPFLAQWNTLTLYPLSLIYLLLPLPWSLNLFCVAHFFLGAVGMFMLARSWGGSALGGAIAGTAYGWSGLLINSLKWPNNIAALGLLPWVIWLARRGWQGTRRDFAAAALVGGLQMLTGAPEIIAMTWIIVAVFAISDFLSSRCAAWLLKAAALPVTVAALAAIQLLPFLDLLQRSQRSANFDPGVWALPVSGLANFLLPLFKMAPSFHGVPTQPGQFWIAGYFVPLLAVVAAFALRPTSRDIKLLIGLFVASLWFAIGDAGYVYAFFRDTVPVLGFMRYPVKFVTMAVVALALWGALSVVRLSDPTSIRKPALAMAAAVLALCVIGISSRYGTAAMLGNAALRCGLLLAAAWLLKTAFTSQRALIGLIVLIAIDGFTHLPRHNPTVSPAVFKNNVPEQPQTLLGRDRAFLTVATETELDHLVPQSPTEDVLASRLMLFCNMNLLDHHPVVNGFYSLYLKEFAQIQDLLSRTNLNPTGLRRFLGIRQVSAGALRWVVQPEPLPMITGGQQPQFGGPETFFPLLAQDTWHPERTVHLDESARPEFSGVTNAQVLVMERVIRNNTVSIRVDASAKSVLVLAQAYDPAWVATINGNDSKVYRANHAFQALIIPEGASQIELRYRDAEFQKGAMISALALIAMLGAWLIPLRGTGSLRRGENVP